jgi:hypothetical protein
MAKEQRTPRVLAVALGALALLACPALGQEWTPEERDAAWSKGNEFAECAGFAWAVADLTTITDADIQQSIRDTGNGAWLASVFFFSMFKSQKEAMAYADQQSDAHRIWWRAHMKTATDSSDIEAQDQACRSLRDLQGKVVAEMRKMVHRIEP